MTEIITEESYDRLPDQSQDKYLYCPDCKNFYLKSFMFCTCTFEKKKESRKMETEFLIYFKSGLKKGIFERLCEKELIEYINNYGMGFIFKIEYDGYRITDRTPNTAKEVK